MAQEFAFDLPPEKAVEFFKKKGLRLGFDWRDVYGQEHDFDFTVAKMMDLDLLSDVHEAVGLAIEEGKTLAEFSAELKPELVKRGWWGQAEMPDPLTGETKLVQLGSPRRLKVIFEANMKASYASGHWTEVEETAEDAPYLMYDAIDDDRTRPEHSEWDDTVLRWDDPWWDTHYPPNGWGCRCGVIQLDAEDLAGLGLAGIDKAPEIETREWVNPRTGEILDIPEGIDPGWNYHPGKARAEQLKTMLSEKEAASPL